MTHREGARIGRFELRRHLATDATTTVWEGLDTALERRVVIKLLRPELAGDALAVARFRQESRTAARARSAVTSRVLDAGFDTASAVPFVVFEWPSTLEADESPGTDPRVETHPRQAPLRRPVGQRTRGNRWLPRLAVLLVGVPVVVAGFLVRRALDNAGGVADVGFLAPPAGTLVVSQPVSVPTPVTPTQEVRSPTPRPTPASVAPRPTATPVYGVRRQIVNTEGIGVALRATPGGDRLPGKGYDEGATVTVLEQSGAWTHIRGDDGREGWVLSVTVG